MENFERPNAARVDAIRGNELQTRFEALLQARAWVFAAFEQWKAAAESKDSQDVSASIVTESSTAALLQSFGGDLPNYFKMSSVDVAVGEQSVTFRPSTYAKCDRSRVRRPDVEQHDGLLLSARDRRVLEEMGALA
jgi:isoleucyl-tRNA synthetase